MSATLDAMIAVQIIRVARPMFGRDCGSFSHLGFAHTPPERAAFALLFTYWHREF
jgi:hypothetical protein